MSKRFEAHAARILVEELIASGADPLADVAPPTRSLDGGCGDPECCLQHSGKTADGKPMLSVRTKVSATRLHKLALTMGLLPK